MNPGHLIVALTLVSITLDAEALYRCVQAEGAVEFQQMPCAHSASQQKLEVRTTTPAIVDRTRVARDQAAAERRLLLRQAINEGRPIVGMTSIELEQAMGLPDKINAAQYGASSQNQLVYYRPGRTVYVYTAEGIVTSYQDTEGSPVQARKACPTSTEIRDIEFDINRLANRDNQLLQRDLHQRLAEARACR